MYPVLNIFGTYISTYTVFVLLGCIAALLIFTLYSRKKADICLFDCFMLLICALIGALAGSKLLYIIVEAREIFSTDGGIWNAIYGGGFVFYGGLLGGIGATALYCKRSNIPVAGFFDTFCPAMCIGHALGRVGCFFAGCCYGCETALPIGVIYPEYALAPSGTPLLPTQLMEAGFLLLLAALLFMLMQKRTKGLVSAVYLIAYSTWRFIIEFFRGDDRGSLPGLSISQFISIFIFIAGIIWLARIICANKKRA